MRRFSLVLIAAVGLAACNKKAEPAAPAAAQGGVNQVQKMGGMAAMAAPQESGEKLTGKIAEKVDSSGYSYLKLSGDQWAAVPQTDKKVGDEVTVVVSMHMDGWESPTLKRKFEKLVFANFEGAAGGMPGAAAPAAGAKMPEGHPAVPAQGQPEAAPAGAENMAHPPVAPIEDAGPIKVAKAEGAEGRTVAEVWAQKDALKGKPVAVRGKVVKYTAQIMGKNWLHLRDGSGVEGKDNDLVVVTGDEAAKGDVVLAKGKLDTDRKLGMGYDFAVLVDEAKLSK